MYVLRPQSYDPSRFPPATLAVSFIVTGKVPVDMIGTEIPEIVVATQAVP